MVKPFLKDSKMEQNRNIDFESDVEVDSLKDALWRLTTRVYLLEDFIAERFGETLGPNGFTNSKSATLGSPTTPVCKICNCITPVGESLNISHPPRRNRKLRKRRHGMETSGSKQQGNSKVQKSETPITEPLETNPLSDAGVPLPNQESIENIQQSDAFLIPKNEIMVPDYNDSEYEDDFFNDKSEEDENVDDESRKDLEHDPDFIPTIESSNNLSQSVQTKTTKKRKRKDGQQAKDSGRREKSVIITNTWKVIEIVEEELKVAWQLRQKYNYRNFRTEYFNCMEGGRKCPAKLKCITLSADRSKTYTSNGLEHNHPRTKSGMTSQQKTTVSELLKENRDITPLIVLEVLKHKGIEIPSSTQVANFLRYKRRKMKEKLELTVTTTASKSCE